MEFTSKPGEMIEVHSLDLRRWSGIPHHTPSLKRNEETPVSSNHASERRVPCSSWVIEFRSKSGNVLEVCRPDVITGLSSKRNAATVAQQSHEQETKLRVPDTSRMLEFTSKSGSMVEVFSLDLNKQSGARRPSTSVEPTAARVAEPSHKQGTGLRVPDTSRVIDFMPTSGNEIEMRRLDLNSLAISVRPEISYEHKIAPAAPVGRYCNVIEVCSLNVNGHFGTPCPWTSSTFSDHKAAPVAAVSYERDTELESMSKSDSMTGVCSLDPNEQCKTPSPSTSLDFTVPPFDPVTPEQERELPVSDTCRMIENMSKSGNVSLDHT